MSTGNLGLGILRSSGGQLGTMNRRLGMEETSSLQNSVGNNTKIDTRARIDVFQKRTA